MSPKLTNVAAPATLHLIHVDYTFARLFCLPITTISSADREARHYPAGWGAAAAAASVGVTAGVLTYARRERLVVPSVDLMDESTWYSILVTSAFSFTTYPSCMGGIGWHSLRYSGAMGANATREKFSGCIFPRRIGSLNTNLTCSFFCIM